MKVVWSPEAAADLGRLADFLRLVAPEATRQVIQSLLRAPESLVSFPRLGTKLEGFSDREVRRLIVGRYELRYEVAGTSLHVLRVWHSREHREPS